MPETPDEGHVEAVMPNGVRLMLDSEEIHPQLPPRLEARGRQPGLAPAFECGSPAEVDEVYARVTEAGFEGQRRSRGTRTGGNGTPSSAILTAFGSTFTRLWNSVSAQAASPTAAGACPARRHQPRRARGRRHRRGARVVREDLRSRAARPDGKRNGVRGHGRPVHRTLARQDAATRPTAPLRPRRGRQGGGARGARRGRRPRAGAAGARVPRPVGQPAQSSTTATFSS